MSIHLFCSLRLCCCCGSLSDSKPRWPSSGEHAERYTFRFWTSGALYFPHRATPTSEPRWKDHGLSDWVAIFPGGVTENGQTGPRNSSLINTGEFGQDNNISADGTFMILGQEGDDPGIVGIDPVYYDKELVHCTEERENQTEPQSPDVDAQVDLPDERA
ncbi:hypothetical protein EDB80DRAFT_692472 [Ilyonectria destructans]|nr:hypothetical protein EDB80DRAFT_692472 [Ilyonectria destructans]